MWSNSPWMEAGRAIGRYRLLSYFGHGVYTSMIAVYLTNEGWNVTEIGLLIAFHFLVGIVIGPVWAVLADATGKHKQIIILCTIGVSGCLLIQTLSLSREGFWGVTILMYILRSAVSPITTGLTASYAERTNGDYGKLQSFGPLGYGLGALSVGWVSSFTGLEIIFYAFAIILLGCVPMLWWFPSESTKKEPWSFHKVRPLFHWQLTSFWLAVILITGPLQSFLSIFGLFVQSAGGNPQDIGVATMFGYTIQWAALRYRRQWFGRWSPSSQELIIYVVVLLIEVRWFVIYLYPSTITFWLAFASQAVGIALLITSFELRMRSIAGEGLTTTAIGVLYSIISLATFGSTFLNGVATDVTGNVFAGALLLGIVSIIGLFALICTPILGIGRTSSHE